MNDAFGIELAIPVTLRQHITRTHQTISLGPNRIVSSLCRSLPTLLSPISFGSSACHCAP